MLFRLAVFVGALQAVHAREHSHLHEEETVYPYEEDVDNMESKMRYDNKYGYDSGYDYASPGYDTNPYPQGYDSHAYPAYASYDTYGTDDYGTEKSDLHPFVDAWFTFTPIGDSTGYMSSYSSSYPKPVDDSGARVSISKGKNDVLVLDHILEDYQKFGTANSEKKNFNCAKAELTDEQKKICVHKYEIGIQLAAGLAYKKYSSNNGNYARDDPAIVAIYRYGSLPVNIPSVKLNCQEVNSRPDSQGGWAEYISSNTVSLKSKYTYGEAYGKSDAVTTVHFSKARFPNMYQNYMDSHLDPPIFAPLMTGRAVWNARGSPNREYVGTCKVKKCYRYCRGGESEGEEDLEDEVVEEDADVVDGDEAALGKRCKRRCVMSLDPDAPCSEDGDCQNKGKGSCTRVLNESGCYPGCNMGNKKPGNCAFPAMAKCVNKPRALHCTAVIELGTQKY